MSERISHAEISKMFKTLHSGRRKFKTVIINGMKLLVGVVMSAIGGAALCIYFLHGGAAHGASVGAMVMHLGTKAVGLHGFPAMAVQKAGAFAVNKAVKKATGIPGSLFGVATESVSDYLGQCLEQPECLSAINSYFMQRLTQPAAAAPSRIRDLVYKSVDMTGRDGDSLSEFLTGNFSNFRQVNPDDAQVDSDGEADA